MTLFDLTGKVAVVTGSSRGIGKAIVERLAEHGAKVVVSSRKATACEEVAASINAKHGAGAALAIPANISSKDELQNLVNETVRVNGQIDILVCNAASNPYYGPLGGIADDQFRKILDNNIISNHWLISMVAPAMRSRKDGAIVIVSSIGGLKGTAIIGAYDISKAADFSLARNLAVEFGADNVRVNCIAPGLIKTDFARALWENPKTLRLRQCAHAPRPHRRSRRDRRRRRVPRLARGRLHDRPDHRHRRRPDHHLIRSFQMKAVLSRAVGGPQSLQLEEIADPAPAKGEALIRIAACGVNFPDALIIEDKYQFKPARPFSPGGEVAEVIEAVGEGVTGLRVGQRVLASTGWGGMAEKVAVESRRIMPIPDAMPFEEAAAFLMTYGTSYYALKDRGALKSGETLLVLGAAGGVGSAAVELGKAMGARVIAAASSEEKVAAAKQWGADEGVVYPSGPFDADGRKALAAVFKSGVRRKGRRCDLRRRRRRLYRGLAAGDRLGRQISGRGFPQGIAKLPLNLTLLKSCQVVGVFWGGFAARDPKANAANTRELFALYEKGAIRPRISKTFSLEQAGDAISWIAERKAMGKVVVTI